jgi:hypothetical protein
MTDNQKQMNIAVEYIKWLQDQRNKINSENLKDIEFYENSMKLDIPTKVFDEFELTGLNNCDFILSGFYKDKAKQ